MRTDASATAEDLSGGWTIAAEGPSTPPTDARGAPVVRDGAAALVEAGEVAAAAEGDLSPTSVDAGFGTLAVEMDEASVFAGGTATLEDATHLKLGFVQADALDAMQSAEALVAGSAGGMQVRDLAAGTGSRSRTCACSLPTAWP